MESSNELAVVNKEIGNYTRSYSKEDLDIIKNSLSSDLTDAEFAYYIRAAQLLNLNPLKREIYAVKYEGRTVLQVGIDGYLKHAESTGKFCGFTDALLTIKDKDDEKSELRVVSQELYDPDQHKLVAAKIGIRHADDSSATFVVVTAKEYAVYFRDRATGGSKLSARWQKAPATQLIKCAKALAVRTRFPGLGGETYLVEELDHVQMTTDAPPKIVAEATIDPGDLSPGKPEDLVGHDDDGGMTEEEKAFITLSAKHLATFRQLFDDATDLKAIDKIGKAITKELGKEMTTDDFGELSVLYRDASKRFRKEAKQESMVE